jgi:hypothetical protein
MDLNDPQQVYARWLRAGTRLVFFFSLGALALYFSGVLRPVVPLDQLPALWAQPASELLRRMPPPAGAGWLANLRYGDGLILVGIALFSLLSLVCALRMVPAFLRNGERVQALLAFLQVLVLAAAAAGLGA